MGSRILDFPATCLRILLSRIDKKTRREHKLFAQERKTMLQSYTALIRQTEGWWIGWILEVRGVICQERTRSELLDTLQITLREVLEFDGPEVSHRTESEVEEVKASDILEFGDPEASHQTESGFEEVKIDV